MKICAVMVLCCCMLSPAFAADRQELVVCSNAEWPPMEFLNKAGQPVGFTMDYFDAVAQEASLAAQYKNLPWNRLMRALEEGSCDIIASSVSITSARRQSMLFSAPYLEIQQAVLLPLTSRAVDAEALRGKRIGALGNTTGFAAALDLSRGKAAEYDYLADGLEDLARGRLDAVICDAPVASYLARAEAKLTPPAYKLGFVMEEQSRELYAFAFRKNADALAQKVNSGIDAVKAKGIAQALIKKWMY